MKIEPTIIKVDDLWKHTSIALIVDREDFIKDIQNTRKKIQLTKLYEYSVIDKSDFSKEQSDLVKSGSYKKSNSEKNIAFVRSVEIIRYLPELYKKYHLRPEYYRIVLFTILCNEVKNQDFVSDTFSFMGSEYKSFNQDLGDNSKWLQKYSGFIVVDPSTTSKELLDEFRWYKSKLNIPDTITNIKRDRKWYWLKKSGLSYAQVHKRALDDGERITRDGVIKAIKQYSEKLSIEI